MMSSSTNMGALLRTARAMASLGRASILRSLAIGQNDDRRVEHRRLGTDDLDALELGAQGTKQYRAAGHG